MEMMNDAGYMFNRDYYNQDDLSIGSVLALLKERHIYVIYNEYKKEDNKYIEYVKSEYPDLKEVIYGEHTLFTSLALALSVCELVNTKINSNCEYDYKVHTKLKCKSGLLVPLYINIDSYRRDQEVKDMIITDPNTCVIINSDYRTTNTFGKFARVSGDSSFMFTTIHESSIFMNSDIANFFIKELNDATYSSKCIIVKCIGLITLTEITKENKMNINETEKRIDGGTNKVDVMFNKLDNIYDVNNEIKHIPEIGDYITLSNEEPLVKIKKYNISSSIQQRINIANMVYEALKRNHDESSCEILINRSTFIAEVMAKVAATIINEVEVDDQLSKDQTADSHPESKTTITNPSSNTYIDSISINEGDTNLKIGDKVKQHIDVKRDPAFVTSEIILHDKLDHTNYMTVTTDHYSNVLIYQEYINRLLVKHHNIDKVRLNTSDLQALMICDHAFVIIKPNGNNGTMRGNHDIVRYSNKTKLFSLSDNIKITIFHDVNLAISVAEYLKVVNDGEDFYVYLFKTYKENMM